MSRSTVSPVGVERFLGRPGAIAGLVAVLVLLSARVSAGPVVVFQERSIVATMSGERNCSPPDSEFCDLLPGAGPVSEVVDVQAPDFEAFDASVSTSGASATQDSRLSAEQIHASGSIRARGVDDEFALGEDFTVHTLARTSARSDFAATFELDAPTAYTFEATVEGNASPASLTVIVRLDGPSGLIHSVPCIVGAFAFPLCGPTTEHHIGTLDPGQYMIDVSSQAFGDPGIGYAPDEYGDASYEVELLLATVPEPLSGATIAFGVVGMLRGRSRRCVTSASRTARPPLSPGRTFSKLDRSPLRPSA